MKAALLTAHNAPLTLAEVESCELQPGQVLVNMLVTGICGAQLAEIRGDKNPEAPMPRLLGHEGCAIVERVGPGVRKVQPGYKVVCHWRKSRGMDAEPPRYVYEGREITSGPIATFAEFAILSENRLTKVASDTPNDLCALLGCGLSTALGVLENDARLKTGESVLVVGCGGVGLNLIRVAKMMGAQSVDAIDVSAEREAQAHKFGAEDSGAHAFDVIVDTTGSTDAFLEALPLLKSGGRYIMIGQPKSDAALVIASARHMFDGEGKTIKATQGGQFNPDADIPRYIAAYRAGHLKINGIVTHRFPLAEINQAIGLVREGAAGRVMIDCV